MDQRDTNGNYKKQEVGPIGSDNNTEPPIRQPEKLDSGHLELVKVEKGSEDLSSEYITVGVVEYCYTETNGEDGTVSDDCSTLNIVVDDYGKDAGPSKCRVVCGNEKGKGRTWRSNVLPLIDVEGMYIDNEVNGKSDGKGRSERRSGEPLVDGQGNVLNKDSGYDVWMENGRTERRNAISIDVDGMDIDNEVIEGVGKEKRGSQRGNGVALVDVEGSSVDNYIGSDKKKGKAGSGRMDVGTDNIDRHRVSIKSNRINSACGCECTGRGSEMYLNICMQPTSNMGLNGCLCKCNCERSNTGDDNTIDIERMHRSSGAIYENRENLHRVKSADYGYNGDDNTTDIERVHRSSGAIYENRENLHHVRSANHGSGSNMERIISRNTLGASNEVLSDMIHTTRNTNINDASTPGVLGGVLSDDMHRTRSINENDAKTFGGSREILSGVMYKMSDANMNDARTFDGSRAGINGNDAKTFGGSREIVSGVMYKMSDVNMNDVRTFDGSRTGINENDAKTFGGSREIVSGVMYKMSDVNMNDACTSDGSRTGINGNDAQTFDGSRKVSDNKMHKTPTTNINEAQTGLNQKLISGNLKDKDHEQRSPSARNNGASKANTNRNTIKNDETKINQDENITPLRHLSDADNEIENKLSIAEISSRLESQYSFILDNGIQDTGNEASLGDIIAGSIEHRGGTPSVPSIPGSPRPQTLKYGRSAQSVTPVSARRSIGFFDSVGRPPDKSFKDSSKKSSHIPPLEINSKERVIYGGAEELEDRPELKLVKKDTGSRLFKSPGRGSKNGDRQDIAGQLYQRTNSRERQSTTQYQRPSLLASKKRSSALSKGMKSTDGSVIRQSVHLQENNGEDRQSIPQDRRSSENAMKSRSSGGSRLVKINSDKLDRDLKTVYSRELPPAQGSRGSVAFSRGRGNSDDPKRSPFGTLDMQRYNIKGKNSKQNPLPSKQSKKFASLRSSSDLNFRRTIGKVYQKGVYASADHSTQRTNTSAKERTNTSAKERTNTSAKQRPFISKTGNTTPLKSGGKGKTGQRVKPTSKAPLLSSSDATGPNNMSTIPNTRKSRKINEPKKQPKRRTLSQDNKLFKRLSAPRINKQPTCRRAPSLNMISERSESVINDGTSSCCKTISSLFIQNQPVPLNSVVSLQPSGNPFLPNGTQQYCIELVEKQPEKCLQPANIDWNLICRQRDEKQKQCPPCSNSRINCRQTDLKFVPVIDQHPWRNLKNNVLPCKANETHQKEKYKNDSLVCNTPPRPRVFLCTNSVSKENAPSIRCVEGYFDEICLND